MFVKEDRTKLAACVQNGIPCKKLLGYYTEEDMKRHGYTYLHVSCRIGWECGRGMCREYEPESDDKN